MPERKARQAVGAGTADCGWGTATRRPCGSGDAERNLKRPRVRENIARRSTPVGKTPGRCKHRVGNGVRRRPRWGVPADPKWAGPITGPGPGRRPDAVSWQRVRTRWYRRGGGSPSGRGRSPPVSRHGKPGVDKSGALAGVAGRRRAGAQAQHKDLGKAAKVSGARWTPKDPTARPGRARQSARAGGPTRQAQVR